jgi:hypothetical protein
MIESIDPLTIPAWDNGTWAIKIVGKNFIPGQTIIFFDHLWKSEVTVLSPS